jgi:hypothetical protein
MNVPTESEIRKYVDLCIGSRPETVFELLDAMVTAMHETADHLASNWQDRRTSAVWTKAAMALDKGAARVAELLPKSKRMLYS